MKLYIAPLLLFLLILPLADVFIYRKLKRSQRWPRISAKVHLAVSVLSYALFIGVLCINRGTSSNHTLVCIMWFLLAFYTYNVVKILSLAVYALSWIPSLGKRVKQCFRILAAPVAIAVMLVVGKGAFVTPYEIEIKHETLVYDRLPKSFDGYRIAVFSDTHVGTYDGDARLIYAMVDSINAQKPNLICFAGDLVNRNSSEIEPFIHSLSGLHAPDGLMAILGNHDYADYSEWNDDAEQLADIEALKNLESKANWTVLDNDHRLIARGSDTIAVIGTGNFTDPIRLRHNDNKKAYPNFSDDRFKIYLQHNPGAWHHHVARKSTVDLMIAGHTHAMQLAVTIGGKRYSPAAFANPEWGGAYRVGKQVLYVNTGIGMVGVPMRIGVPPEVTVITLKSFEK